MLPVDVCVKELARGVKTGVLPMSVALAPLTVTPARVYRISDRKGSLQVGKDADVLILNDAYEVDTLFCRGQLMVRDGAAVIKGYLEDPLLKVIG
jgi:imidazolonepropionase-like amidohydrolase